MSFGDLFAPIVASVMTLAFIFAMFKGRKHAALPESLQDPSFQLKDLYIVGLAWEDMIPALSYRSGLSDKIKPSVQMLYGEKYAEYYTRMYLAKIITYTQLVMTALALAAALMPGFLGVAFSLFSIVAGLLVGKNYLDEPRKRVEERADDCIIEFPNLVTKIALLLNAGVTLREAWFLAAKSSQGALRDLLEESCTMMENGKSDYDAISSFAAASGSEEMRKFSMSIIQSMEKGNAELSRIMMQQATELWSLKKQRLLQRGEKAATKLVIPISLMFVGVIIVVLTCALSGLSL